MVVFVTGSERLFEELGERLVVLYREPLEFVDTERYVVAEFGCGEVYTAIALLSRTTCPYSFATISSDVPSFQSVSLPIDSSASTERARSAISSASCHVTLSRATASRWFVSPRRGASNLSRSRVAWTF
ncbi:hypothetical protein D8S78_23205 [Natrialba swarupiae]|nr:hypothetical protein [Natrialba swarupiae]